MLLRPFIAAVLLLGSAGLGWVAYKAVNPTQLAPLRQSPVRR